MKHPYRSKERSPIELSYLLRQHAPEGNITLTTEFFNGTQPQEFVTHVVDGDVFQKNGEDFLPCSLSLKHCKKTSIDYFIDFITEHSSLHSLQKQMGWFNTHRFCVIGTEKFTDHKGNTFYPIAWYFTDDPHAPPVLAKLSSLKGLGPQTQCVLLCLK